MVKATLAMGVKKEDTNKNQKDKLLTAIEIFEAPRGAHFRRANILDICLTSTNIRGKSWIIIKKTHERKYSSDTVRKYFPSGEEASFYFVLFFVCPFSLCPFEIIPSNDWRHVGDVFFSSPYMYVFLCVWVRLFIMPFLPFLSGFFCVSSFTCLSVHFIQSERPHGTRHDIEEATAAGSITPTHNRPGSETNHRIKANQTFIKWAY